MATTPTLQQEQEQDQHIAFAFALSSMDGYLIVPSIFTGQPSLSAEQPTYPDEDPDYDRPPMASEAYHPQDSAAKDLAIPETISEGTESTSTAVSAALRTPDPDLDSEATLVDGDKRESTLTLRQIPTEKLPWGGICHCPRLSGKKKRRVMEELKQCTLPMSYVPTEERVKSRLEYSRMHEGKRQCCIVRKIKGMVGRWMRKGA
jgi:hypothetical protein